ncbi:hypothetical protein, partial [Streptomyces sp. NPDC017949]|uniref:hypothetical protein n=1 Tax=Streptomyces sp. NPDC017949 TaxID=3365020 RepID=UPI00378C19EB
TAAAEPTALVIATRVRGTVATTVITTREGRTVPATVVTAAAEPTALVITTRVRGTVATTVITTREGRTV